ncbi:RNA polymerase sigma-70 factor [Chitinophaga nivalis]|uniref:RNA polymerase sigma-70 factor n=1 Tax=Chitinophaga nivalis TaxID=2991709 RepID=A0ABT3IM02_9BACT|nr:RNA polymerase sigma-70 factor [Chitinophaga nivalis]MCW3485002.1 RNA polymerase sigma-70 factor [Chitinophaga nivalis]
MAGQYADNSPYGKLKIDEDTFFRLYDAYWMKLYHLAYKYLEDAYEAEGLVQDVFTSLWQRRDELVLEENTAENYLVRAVRYRISRNYNDEIRKAKKLEELSVRLPATENRTEQDLFCRFLKKEIDRLVTTLPDRCRLVYQLSRNEGLNNREIALDLLISEKTVENQLTKALKLLRRGIGKYLAD